MTISIQPEPTREELAAIVAAVTAALALREDARSSPTVSPSQPSQPSRWARQGRRDAMRGLDREVERESTRSA